MSEVAVLGPRGTFTEEAAARLRPGSSPAYKESVEEVFDYVSGGRGEGVVAVENSLEGSVGATLTCLLEEEVWIVGEVDLEIVLSLMALDGTNLQDIGVVMSHSHALAQCRRYLRENLPGAVAQSVQSTAEAMEKAAAKKGSAAIGRFDAGVRNGLVAVAEDIQDMESRTRFLMLSSERSSGDKASIIFSVADEPGALYDILGEFADKKVNMTRIESRPQRKNLGEYLFYVDFECGHMSKTDLGGFLDALRDKAVFFKELGSY